MQRDDLLGEDEMSRSQTLATNAGQTKPAPNGSGAILDEIWDDLRLGIESAYQQQTMSKSRFMILYSYVMGRCRLFPPK